MKNKKYGSTLSLDERVKLFKDWLENGGIDTIWSVELIDDLIKVKVDSAGKVIKETVSPLVNAAMLAYEGSQISPPFGSIEFLSEYDTTLQKSLFFDQENIESEDQFDKILEELIRRNDILFRGVREAKWRLYSSLQRHWVDKKLFDSKISYQEFIESILENARKEQDSVLSKFLYLNKIDPENDIAVLSFLQHHGCPTPLLDWTYSFLNSLYFALDGIEYTDSKREIDQYFSVYHIEEKQIKPSNIKDVIEESLNAGHEKLKSQIIKNNLHENVDEYQLGNIFNDKTIHSMAKLTYGKGLIKHLTKIKNLIDAPITYFSDFDNDEYLQFSLNNNLNIVNQYGAFVWNSDSSKPLEQMGNEQIVKEHGNSDGYKFCSCYNINKKLIDHVRGRIEEKGIVKNFIYPDPSEIAWNSFEKTLVLKLNNKTSS